MARIHFSRSAVSAGSALTMRHVDKTSDFVEFNLYAHLTPFSLQSRPTAGQLRLSSNVTGARHLTARPPHTSLGCPCFVVLWQSAGLLEGHSASPIKRHQWMAGGGCLLVRKTMSIPHFKRVILFARVHWHMFYWTHQSRCLKWIRKIVVIGGLEELRVGL